MHKLRIAGLSLLIKSNHSLLSSLFDKPMAHGLCTFFHTDHLCVDDQKTDISFIHDSGTSGYQISMDGSSFSILGNMDVCCNDGINKQYRPSGNKGILCQYILHALETKLGRVGIHACALVNHDKKKIILGLGSSGGGKSALVLSAIKNGWEILGSEIVIVDEQLNFYEGNTFDNISEKSIKNIHAVGNIGVDRSGFLDMYFGKKYMADFSAYKHSTYPLSLAGYDMNLVFVSFGNPKHAEGTLIDHEDFVLRGIQDSITEKLCKQVVIGREIQHFSFLGDGRLRDSVARKIYERCSSFTFLGGDAYDFESFVKKL